MKKIILSVLISVITLAATAQNVGIGTSSPGTKLDVTGAVTYRDTTLAITGNTTIPTNNHSQVVLTAGTGLAAGFNLTPPTAPNTGEILVIYNKSGYTATLQSTVNTAVPTAVATQFVYTSGGWIPTAPSSSSAVSSFSAGTTGFTPSSVTSGAVTLAGTLNVANGGTGLTSLTANNLIYGNGTSAASLLAPAATTGELLMNTASAAPSWTTLTSLPTTAGILPVANGGTGVSSLTVGNTISGNTITTTVNGTTGAAQTVPNIYTADGTLTLSRTVTMGADNLTFSSSTGNMIFNPSSTGKVGIGTASPGASLDVEYTPSTAPTSGTNIALFNTNDSYESILSLKNTSSGGGYFQFITSGGTASTTTTNPLGTKAFGIYDGNANAWRMSINSLGYHGIGTASPAAAFDVQTPITATTAGTYGTRLQQTLTAYANNNALTALYINPTFSNGSYTGNTNNGLIVTSGNAGIGIGATSPLAISGVTTLQIGTDSKGIGASDGEIILSKNSGSSAYRSFKMGLNSNYAFSLGDFGGPGSATSHTYKEYMTVNYNNGYVGIGTYSATSAINGPYTNLDVVGSIYTSNHGNASEHDASEQGTTYIGHKSGNTGDGFAGMGINIGTGTAGTAAGKNNASVIQFYTWGNTIGTSREVVRINEAGYLGIGTTSPATSLDVNGVATIRGGSPAAGYALTSSDANGTGTWVYMPKKNQLINQNYGAGTYTAGQTGLSAWDGFTIYGTIDNTGCNGGDGYYPYISSVVIQYSGGNLYCSGATSGSSYLSISGSGTQTLSIRHCSGGGCSGTCNTVTLSVASGQMTSTTTTNSGYFRYEFTWVY